jgi:hypothetical protein
MRCGQFQVETVKDFRQPSTVTPGNQWTYDRVTERVILLVEKNGDTRYNATVSGQTKIRTYLDFVIEAEKDIIRREGYWQWLLREQRIYLKNGVVDYEGPEDLGEIDYIRPGNFTGPPLVGMDSWTFQQRIGSVARATAGNPNVWILGQESVNNRKTITLFPTPLVSTTSVSNNDDPYVIIRYFARMLRPYEPDVQIPFVPQEHIDVLVYGAAAHALMIDSDAENANLYAQAYQAKMQALRRANNRPISGRGSMIRHASNVYQSTATSRVPLLRAEQLSLLTL